MKNQEYLEQLVEYIGCKFSDQDKNMNIASEIKEMKDCVCGEFFLQNQTFPCVSLMLTYNGDIHVFFFPISYYEALVLCAQGVILPPMLSIMITHERFVALKFKYNTSGTKESVKNFCYNISELGELIYSSYKQYIAN